MKKLNLIALLSVGLMSVQSCAKITMVGKFDTLSTNQIDESKQYELKSKCIELTKRQIKKESCGTLQGAVEKTSRKYQNNGTEFLKNARVYSVYKDYPFFYTIQYTVIADVWAEKK